MDPNACFVELIKAFLSDDRKSLSEHCRGLHFWLESGGFMPNNKREIKQIFGSLLAVDEKVELTDFEKRLLRTEKIDTAVECVLERTNLSEYAARKLIVDYLNGL